MNTKIDYLYNEEGLMSNINSRKSRKISDGKKGNNFCYLVENNYSESEVNR